MELAATKLNTPTSDLDEIACEYLTFALGKEEYAIDILKVQEIRGYETVTNIANAPSFIKGVINLRGVIVPIIDMRIKFNLQTEYTPFTIVIILNVRDRVIGMVVDSVSDVISLTSKQIRPAPDFSSSFDTKYILGLASLDTRMIILADIEKLMSSEDMALMNAVAH